MPSWGPQSLAAAGTVGSPEGYTGVCNGNTGSPLTTIPPSGIIMSKICWDAGFLPVATPAEGLTAVGGGQSSVATLKKKKSGVFEQQIRFRSLRVSFVLFPFFVKSFRI